MARFAVLSLLVFLSTACTSLTNQGLEAFNKGDCGTAERLFLEAAQKGEPMAINNLGVVQESCYRNVEAAVPYYTLAARRGVDLARVNLTRLGRPVPPADLVPRSSYDPAAAALALELMRMGQPRPAPQQPASTYRPPTNCTTTFYGGVAQTTCY
jgi:hypothetical protein